MVNLYSYIIYMENKKNILIIASSSEIGQAIIKVLGTSSYTIITASRTGENSNYILDLTDSKSISAFEKKIGQTPFHFIFYCAGFIKASEALESFESEYGIVSQQVNFTAATRLFTTLIPNIQEGGGIIALSSTAGIWGNPKFPIYSSWKAALNTFLQSLHKQYIESNKYVFSICPGPTNTQMRQLLAGDATKHQTPDAVASCIVKIMEHPTEYIESPTLVIRENVLYKLEQELIRVQ